MLTIFTIPKPFLGHVAIIQQNAIQSWTRLRPACEIILFGNEPGLQEAAAEFKVKHVPDIDYNEYRTPLLNSVFARVPQIASHRLMCYVNADIIVLSDLIKAVERTRLRRFLMLGQHWNVDLAEHWDFDKTDWEERLRNLVAKHGVIGPPEAIDYFVFPNDDALLELPPFAVGRPGWDNWFIYHARRLAFPVVDATRVVRVIHQTHDYSHVPNRRGNVWGGPEADRNRELMGGSQHAFTVLNATHVLTSKKLVPAIGSRYLLQRLLTQPTLAPVMKSLALFKHSVLGILRSIRLAAGSR